jgi:hypothetical protein
MNPAKFMVALSQQQSLRLIDLLQETPLRLPVFLALTTGMRRGELSFTQPITGRTWFRTISA